MSTLYGILTAQTWKIVFSINRVRNVVDFLAYSLSFHVDVEYE